MNKRGGKTNKTTIPWCDYTWNPLTGCTKISEGCKHCYANSMTCRFNAGDFSVKFHAERLNQPEKVSKPSKIFICSMSDLFHDDVSMRQFKLILKSMSQTPRHTYIILTKRPKKAIERITRLYTGSDRENSIYRSVIERCWLGVTVENQRRADERIPLLLNIPSSVRFLSVEPLLEAININRWLTAHKNKNRVDWVIAGPERGAGARPCDPEWIAALATGCKSSNVPFFDKRAKGSRTGSAAFPVMANNDNNQ